MASSKVMASTLSSNSDLPRQSSICSLTIAELQSDQSRNFGSMSMEDLLKNIYADAALSPETFSSAGDTNGGAATASDAAALPRQGSFSLPRNMGNKTVEEVWKEIVAGSEQRRGGDGLEEMTLEDFLAKAGAVREEELRVPGPATASAVNYGVDSIFQAVPVSVEGTAVVGFGNGVDGRVVVAGRGKRKTVEEPMDKATQQKQRRMIKNRESAARSRERKQAYTIELEASVIQLEEENARLLREEVEQSKKRFKQLMENLIPVVEKRRPQRALRRVHSVSW